MFRKRDALGQATPDDYPRIYLFGDSLTEWGFEEHNAGFGWQLQKYYDERVEIINEGYAGQTSLSLRRAFDKSVVGAARTRGPPAPLFITIFLGANDACLNMNSTLVPLPEYETHIRHYIDTVLNDPATQDTKVVLISPPPVNVPGEVQHPLLDSPEINSILREVAMSGRGYRTWESKRTFAKKIIEIGKEFEAKTERVAVLDFWSLLTKSACKIEGMTQDEAFCQMDVDEMLPGSGLPGAKSFEKGYFTDGLHFGEKAYEILGCELLSLVLLKWPELERENFPCRNV